MLPWRLEIKFAGKLVEKSVSWPFPNPHCAIALHVAMATHRTQARAGSSDLSAQQHEIDDLLNVGDCVLVLRQSHRPAEDCPLRLDEDLCRVFDSGFVNATLIEEVAPVHLAQRSGEPFKAGCILVDKFMIQHTPRIFLFLS